MNIFNIRNNTKPVRGQFGYGYVGTEPINMNNDELITFIEDVIVEHTHQPAELLFDALDYQHNDRTKLVCNNHNITLYKIPASTTAWLQPCDVLSFGLAKQTLKKTNKQDL